MTSIEWLEKELLRNGYMNKGYYNQDSLNHLENILKQAKEMHKAEHGKTWDSALDAGQNRAWNVMRAYSDFDEYYNETYKKD